MPCHCRVHNKRYVRSPGGRGRVAMNAKYLTNETLPVVTRFIDRFKRRVTTTTCAGRGVDASDLHAHGEPICVRRVYGRVVGLTAEASTYDARRGRA